MFKDELGDLILKAKGDKKLQLVLKNANIINVFSG